VEGFLLSVSGHSLKTKSFRDRVNVFQGGFMYDYNYIQDFLRKEFEMLRWLLLVGNLCILNFIFIRKGKIKKTTFIENVVFQISLL